MMTPEVYRNAPKPDLHAGLGSMMKVIQLRSQAGAGVSTIAGKDLVQADLAITSLGENALTADQKRAIQKELRKVLQSPLLVQSNRLCRFLSFAVEMTLNGNGDSLKEYTIGIEAYGRRQDFEPSQDSIVRTEARRLRTKLKQYYQEEGEDDPVFIYFRPGSYVPVFHVNGATKGSSHNIRERETALMVGPKGISISVVPFAYLPGDSFAEACARGLTDEFIHSLTKTEGIRVFACPAEPTGFSADVRLGRKHEGWITSEGSVRTEGNRIRVTSRIYDVEGLHIASWRFDEETNPDELFGALEKVALKIVSSIERHKASIADA